MGHKMTKQLGPENVLEIMILKHNVDLYFIYINILF